MLNNTVINSVQVFHVERREREALSKVALGKQLRPRIISHEDNTSMHEDFINGYASYGNHEREESRMDYE